MTRHFQPFSNPFECGCIVFYRNKRCIFVMFDGYCAVIGVPDKNDSYHATVVNSDAIEFISKGGQSSIQWARERVPHRGAHWTDPPRGSADDKIDRFTLSQHRAYRGKGRNPGEGARLDLDARSRLDL